MLATYLRRGFSLLELVAVIVVVTILAAVPAIFLLFIVDIPEDQPESEVESLKAESS